MTLADAAAELRWPAFRLKQIQHAREIELQRSWDSLTNLSKSDRDYLAANVPFDSIEEVRRTESKERTAIKFLFRALDGATFETVLLIHSGVGRRWGTVCVSSQVGCPVGCKFCATGQMQLKRNLTSEEIVDQFIVAKRVARERNITGNLNIVFMGMGEPLLNADAVIAAIQTLTDPKRLGLAPSRITVSTSGIIPGLKKLFDAKLGIGLALSLHAPNDEIRSQLMPINKVYKLEKVLEALLPWEYAGTEVLHEYVLIDGRNDSDENARELAALLRHRHAKLNLIPLNPVPGTGLARPPIERMRAFLRIVSDAGIRATLRHTKGDDIAAACGQLKTKQDAEDKAQAPAKEECR